MQITPSEEIKVFVRVRPLSLKEKDLNSGKCIKIQSDFKSIEISPPKEDTKKELHTFHHCFSESDDQAFVYEKICFPLLENIFDIRQTTIFAYGQTGCGKTYSMMGSDFKEELKGWLRS